MVEWNDMSAHGLSPMSRTAQRVLASLLAVVLASLVASACVTPGFTFPDSGSGGGIGGGSGGSAPTGGLGGEGSAPLPAHCTNNSQDEGETARDCGGECGGCGVGEACELPRDCAAPPIGGPDVVNCFEKKCILDCQIGFADCNSSAKDGCEVNLGTDLEHCGQCGAECNPPHAVGRCMGGDCEVKTDEANQGCDANYANCNLNDTDGCEVNLAMDADHCGACQEAACSRANGTPTCGGSICTIQCDPGYADCDGNPRENGCEVRISSNVNHCGRCDNLCMPTDPDAVAYCGDEGCGETTCASGKGDCDGDGVCSDDLTMIDNCGQCGASCTVQDGVAQCLPETPSATCAVESCNGDFDDCDGLYETGCEVNTKTSSQHCGGCLPDEGGTGVDCTRFMNTEHITVASCEAGRCEATSCETRFADCDGEIETGCEVDTQNDPQNCGGCASGTGIVCQSKPHASSMCTEGGCEYSCDANWVDTNLDLYQESGSNGCETPQFAVVGKGVWGSLEVTGPATRLTFSHQLSGTKGTGRVIVVGVICRDTSSNATNCQLLTPTYGGVALTVGQRVHNNQSGAAIYYALDAALPAAGPQTLSLGKNGAGTLSAEVVEFQAAEQTSTLVTAGDTNGSGCVSGSGADVDVTLSQVPAGNIIYAVGGGAQNTKTGGSAVASLPFMITQNHGADFVVFGSSLTARLPNLADRTPLFDLTGCNQSSIAAVALKPAPK